MFKLAIIGLLVSQAALADYKCSYGQDKSLTLKVLNHKDVIVMVKDGNKTQNYEGILVKSAGEDTRFKTYDYELANALKEPAQLFIWYTVHYGSCGRGACHETQSTIISANFTKDGVKTSYVCSKTNL